MPGTQYFAKGVKRQGHSYIFLKGRKEGRERDVREEKVRRKENR